MTWKRCARFGSARRAQKGAGGISRASKRQESRARLNPMRPPLPPCPVLFALTALACRGSLLLLRVHLHSAWRLPPPKSPPSASSTPLPAIETGAPPPAASHHPQRKIIICHIHQYTVLHPSLPPIPIFFFVSLSLNPYPPLARFLSLSLRVFLFLFLSSPPYPLLHRRFSLFDAV